MEQISEYKAAGIAAIIFTIYLTIQTTVGSATVGSNELSISWIFLGEAFSFIPLGILLFFLIWLRKKKPQLFFEFSTATIMIHLIIALFIMSLHAVWEVYCNEIFFGRNFNFASIKWNFFGLLEMRGMFYLTIVGLIFAIHSLREHQQIIEKESDLRLKIQKAQLGSVELKMNPDMIYPNLSFIRDNLEDNPNKSSQMVIQLSNLLRALVDKIEDSQIILAEDVQIFEKYMKLIQLRLGYAFNIQTDISGTRGDEKVPSVILLMPFFESFFFGKHRSSVSEVSSISLQATLRDDSAYTISIKIDGVFDQTKLTNNPGIKLVLKNLGRVHNSTELNKIDVSSKVSKDCVIILLRTNDVVHHEAPAYV